MAPTTLSLDRHIESNIYNFTVSNVHSLPVVAIIVGRDTEYRFLSMPSRIPEEMISPPGWAGVGTPGEESSHLTFRWIGYPNSEAQISSGATISGFGMRMPPGYPADEIKYKNLFDTNNQPVTEMDLTTAPFRVIYSDGSCYIGEIEAQK
jgi:hypothetical protein